MLKKSIIAIFIFIMVAAISQAANDIYLWPTKLPPELTSKFCDYRAGHFHGGLDIRTGGRIGVPVYAIDDGYVFRVATSFRGYGKALYLKLKDSRIIVYGHLSDFSQAIDARVLAAQLKDKKYTQDLYYTSSEFPVKKGQQVALSGESGTGAPHLHFEMRSSENNPINPLESGYSLPDRIAPEFDELAIRYYRHGFNPGDPCEIEFLPIIRGKNGSTYTVSDTIISDGDLALAVAGGDRAEGAGFFYGYFELRLLVDDSLVFRVKSDSLSYNTTRQLNYVRDLELIRLFARKTKTDNDLGIFYRLYVPPHAKQYFWPGFTDNSGIIAPGDRPGDVRKISIGAIDEAGNQSELWFYLKTPDLPLPEAISYQDNRDTLRIYFPSSLKTEETQIEYRNQISQPYKITRNTFSSRQTSESSSGRFGNFLRMIAANGEYRFRIRDMENHYSPWTYFCSSETKDEFQIYGSPNYLRLEYSTAYPEPIVEVRGERQDTSFKMIPAGISRYAADLIDQGLSGATEFIIKNRGATILDTEIVLCPVAPDESGKIYSPDSSLSISFQNSSAFYPTYVFSSKGEKAATAFGQAIIYYIEPEAMLVDTPLKLNFDVAKLGLTGRKVGAYGYSYDTGGWSFIGKIDGAKLEASAFGLGKLALFEDNDPPVIRSVAPSGAVKNRTPLLSCNISDGLSGLALDSGLSMIIDGAWVPAEFDIDGNRFSYKVKNPLSYGKHQFEINAADNQGNITSKITNFTVTAK